MAPRSVTFDPLTSTVICTGSYPAREICTWWLSRGDPVCLRRRAQGGGPVDRHGGPGGRGRHRERARELRQPIGLLLLEDPAAGLLLGLLLRGLDRVRKLLAAALGLLLGDLLGLLQALLRDMVGEGLLLLQVVGLCPLHPRLEHDGDRREDEAGGDEHRPRRSRPCSSAARGSAAGALARGLSFDTASKGSAVTGAGGVVPPIAILGAWPAGASVAADARASSPASGTGSSGTGKPGFENDPVAGRRGRRGEGRRGRRGRRGMGGGRGAHGGRE